MPTKPNLVTLTNASVDVLNAIRNSASINYQDYVPIATPDAESIREIGAVIMDMPALQNEFINALINRIARVIVSSKMYENPWAFFKRGMLDFGETIEEVFVEIAKPFQFDPAAAETELFKREKPDVKSAFHVLNYKKFYKVTIENDELRQAFLSMQGVTDLIAKIVESLYKAANYDEYQVMKYMLARNILTGMLAPVEIPAVSTANMKEIVSDIKGTANDFTFLSQKYNRVKVRNSSTKDNMYIILDTKFDAKMDVEVLASAFNMDKAQFIGQRVLVDGFGSLDTARLAELFKDDANYKELSEAEKTALNSLPCVLVDKDFFMIFDNLFKFTEEYNGQGLYWNYFFHVWKIFSVSPFANAAFFIPATPSVTSVTLSPAAATVDAGGSIQLTANVQVENFAPEIVNYQSNTDGITVDSRGVVSIASTVTTGTSATITATSEYDTSVTGTATITVG